MKGVRTAGCGEGGADGTPGGRAEKPPALPTVKRTICLSYLADLMLDDEAHGERTTRSAIVERLVTQHCVNYRVEKVRRPPVPRAG